MSFEPMDLYFCFHTYKEAKMWIRRFAEMHSENIKRVDFAKRMVVFNDGSLLYFKVDSELLSFTKGRELRKLFPLDKNKLIEKWEKYEKEKTNGTDKCNN